MRQDALVAHAVACVSLVVGCGFPRPADVGGMDATGGVDAMVVSIDAPGGGVDGPVDGVTTDGAPSQVCTPNQALRCDSDTLVRCNSDGSAEVRQNCLLGCNAINVRCNDVDPSNGLAQYLDMTASEPDLDLGAMVAINTDDGTVIVDGQPIAVKHATIIQNLAPSIRVLVVHSLIARDVTVIGTSALAIVSNGDLTVGGVLAASARGVHAGAGAFNDGTCQGGPADSPGGGVVSGAGGGGFGQPGGVGGTATNSTDTAVGGAAGTITGNATLVPLRGGCDSGHLGNLFGAGGGAIQLVSRTKISISGVVAANGSAGSGGGSGGGILLEAPLVEVSGAVVANGGGGASGCILSTQGLGEDGHLDATRAAGGMPCSSANGAGGPGGARDVGAGGIGQSINGGVVLAGYGGGGVGRIRVNTTSGGLHVTGVLSPNPSTATITTR